MWDVRSGALLRTLELHDGPALLPTAIAPNGSRVASADIQDVKLWDPFSGALLHTFTGIEPGLAMTFSSDGTRLLAGEGERALNLWDATTGKLLRTFKGQSAMVGSVALSPDGTRIVSGSYDHTIKLWDARTGKLLRTIRDQSHIVSLAFSSDSTRFLSVSLENGAAKLWDAYTGEALHTVKEPFFSAAFVPDNTRLITVGAEMKLWDGDGTLLRTLQQMEDGVTTMSVSRDGSRLLTGMLNNAIKVWDMSSGALLRTFEGYAAEVSSVVFLWTARVWCRPAPTTQLRSGM